MNVLEEFRNFNYSRLQIQPIFTQDYSDLMAKIIKGGIGGGGYN